jgi:hypothetical protein
MPADPATTSVAVAGSALPGATFAAVTVTSLHLGLAAAGLAVAVVATVVDLLSLRARAHPFAVAAPVAIVLATAMLVAWDHAPSWSVVASIALVASGALIGAFARRALTSSDPDGARDSRAERWPVPADAAIGVLLAWTAAAVALVYLSVPDTEAAVTIGSTAAALTIAWGALTWFAPAGIGRLIDRDREGAPAACPSPGRTSGPLVSASVGAVAGSAVAATVVALTSGHVTWVGWWVAKVLIVAAAVAAVPAARAIIGRAHRTG